MYELWNTFDSETKIYLVMYALAFIPVNWLILKDSIIPSIKDRSATIGTFVLFFIFGLSPVNIAVAGLFICGCIFEVGSKIFSIRVFPKTA